MAHNDGVLLPELTDFLLVKVALEVGVEFRRGGPRLLFGIAMVPKAKDVAHL
jgi:hypothetical protein